MSLPNYIVNLEEMVKAIAQGYTSMKLMSSGRQRSKGLVLSSDMKGSKAITWVAPHDLVITGIRFGVDDIRNLGYSDYWDMYIDDVQIMSSVFLKEVNEYKRFRNFYPVVQGQAIKFVYHNIHDIPKEIWYDIDYIQTDIPTIEVTIICRDIINNIEIKKYNAFYNPPITAIIKAPNLMGYEAIPPLEATVSIKMDSLPQTVVFNYEPTKREVIIICLDEYGNELKRESQFVLPPITKTFNAPHIIGYNRVGQTTQTVNIEAGIEPVMVYFYYKIEEKTIQVVCIDEETGEEIKRVTRICTPPTIETINAPNVDGYELTSDSPIEVEITADSPTTQTVTFFYKTIELPPIEHDYDYKIVMRWEGNCNTDMDLHLYFDKNTNRHIYYGQKELEVNGGKAWLDYDHIFHTPSNAFDTLPEIITILGKPCQVANVKVHAYSRDEELTQDVVVEIYKVNAQGADILQQKFNIKPYDVRDRGAYYVCDIDLETGQIIPVQRRLSHISNF